MTIIRNQHFEGERPLFEQHDLRLEQEPSAKEKVP